MMLLWYEWLTKSGGYGSSKYIWKPLNWLSGRSLPAVWDEVGSDAAMLAILHAGVVEARATQQWGREVALFNPGLGMVEGWRMENGE